MNKNEYVQEILKSAFYYHDNWEKSKSDIIDALSFTLIEFINDNFVPHTCWDTEKKCGCFYGWLENILNIDELFCYHRKDIEGIDLIHNEETGYLTNLENSLYFNPDDTKYDLIEAIPLAIEELENGLRT